MISFADLPWAFLLVPAFLLWLGLWWLAARYRTGKARRRHAAIRFSSLANLKRLRPSSSLWQRRFVQGLRAVTVLLLLTAFLRPQTGRRLTSVNTEGIDIVLALDTSGSMQALDLDADREIGRRRHRLDVAKTVVEDFVRRRENDQVGLVVFGENAFTQCPLTLDHGILVSFLERVEIGMAGDATAIGSALGTAVKRLRESEAESKVVILLTDGRSNAGSLTPEKAAEVAATLDVKVYTIGVGKRGKAPFLVDTLFGRDVVYQDVEIDETTLRRIAETTGGAYFRAEDTEALNAIYEQIDQLEKTEIVMESYLEYDERFRWFVGPAIALLLGELILLGTRFRKLP